MKNLLYLLFFFLVFLLILPACQNETPQMETSMSQSIPQSQTEATMQQTMETTEETKNQENSSMTKRTYPTALPEMNPEIEKNRDVIHEVLTAEIFMEYWNGRKEIAQVIADNTAESLAKLFYMLEIPELKEIEITGSREDVYLVRFVDVNDDAYSVSIHKKTGGGFSCGVWKEGEENPLFFPH